MLGKQGLEYTYRKGRMNVTYKHVEENHAIEPNQRFHMPVYIQSVQKFMLKCVLTPLLENRTFHIEFTIK